MEYIEIGTIIAALLTAVGSTYIAESLRKKNEGDAAKSLIEGAMDMVEVKSKEIEQLKADQTILRLYAGYLHNGVELLQQQIIKKGEIPIFDPKPLEEYKK